MSITASSHPAGIVPEGDGQPGQSLLGRSLVATLCLAVAIAWYLPFDATLHLLTGGETLARVALTAALVLAGAGCAQAAGLRLEGHGVQQPALLGAGAAVAMAAYVVLLDGLLFRFVLSPDYVALFDRPLSERYAYFMLRAFNENVVYRLFVFSALLAALTRLHRGKPVPPPLVVLAMILAQVSNIWPNVVAGIAHPSAVVLCYDGLRYIVPGVVWALLFRRNGFAVAEIASVGCHLFIQPALGWML